MDVETGTAADTAAADAALANAAPTAPLPPAAFDALLLLLEWMNSRFDDANATDPAPVCPDPMPNILELWRQRLQLESRLQMFANDVPYKKLWEGQPGTAIMKSVGTEARFYDGCGDFWHLFKHMACKTANEAVVEGMGGEWDDCTSLKRHIAFETGVKEAVISATMARHPSALRRDPSFAEHSILTLRVGLKSGTLSMSHEDKRFRGIVWAGGSKVIDRQLKVKPRLPSAVYGDGS